MPIETYPFDPARYLKSDAERAIYLAEAIETNDPDFIADALAVVARSRDLPSDITEQASKPTGSVDLGSLLSSMRELGLRLTAKPT